MRLADKKLQPFCVKALLKIIIGNFIILFLILLFIEGATSYALLASDVARTPSLAERVDTKYDPDLGRINEPNLYIENMYGLGVYLKTNSQGFRNNHDFDTEVPAQKRRIICSGDSLTLGYRVDNDQTWSSQLESFDLNLETVNMGQGGYGVDQACLWYKRDARRIKHDVHIFSFVTLDFHRMKRKSFWGFGKPAVRIEHGRLRVQNTPVPKAPFMLPLLTANLPNVKRLRAFEFARRASDGIGRSKSGSSLARKESQDDTRQVLAHIFVELRRLNQERRSRLVLVYLPMLDVLANEGGTTMGVVHRERSESVGD